MTKKVKKSTCLQGMLVAAPLLAALVAVDSAADEREDALKTAFLYQFSKYVSWPNDVGAHMDICLLHSDIAPAELERYNSKTANGKAVNMRVVDREEALANCDLLYVGDSAADGDAVVAALQGKPVLLVGESERFFAAGGMINFIRKGIRLKFELSPERMGQAGLQPSAQLLKAASSSQ